MTGGVLRAAQVFSWPPGRFVCPACLRAGPKNEEVMQ